MSSHITVDPVTRIEGHLRIEAEVENGRVANAWSSSTMFRGIELILQGRDPRDAWAFTQRICGVCTTVHAIASIRAVEDAIGAVPPPNARVLRNLIIAAQCVQDHVVHFYHLHALDWVDVVSALSADPSATAIRFACGGSLYAGWPQYAFANGPSWPRSTKPLSRALTPVKYAGLELCQSEIDCASVAVSAGSADSADTTSTQSSACR